MPNGAERKANDAQRRFDLREAPASLREEQPQPRCSIISERLLDWKRS